MPNIVDADKNHDNIRDACQHVVIHAEIQIVDLVSPDPRAKNFKLIPFSRFCKRGSQLRELAIRMLAEFGDRISEKYHPARALGRRGGMGDHQRRLEKKNQESEGPEHLRAFGLFIEQ